jgi:hypothetical protein
MSARLGITIGLTLAALAFGGWRIMLPGADSASTDVDGSVSAMLSTVVKAQFTGAEASLDAQRIATGSYAGAVIQAPIVLVRADDAPAPAAPSSEQGWSCSTSSVPGGTIPHVRRCQP